MPYSFEFDLSSIEGLLDDLGNQVGKAAAKGLYKGAGIVADALTESIAAIQTEPFHYAKEGEQRLPSPQEKEALMRGKHGVAKFKGDGTEIETSIGLGDSGYMHIMGTGSSKDKRTPVALIAHAIDSGTSFMQAQPFLKRAFSKSRGSALSAISATAEQELQNIINAHE